MALARFLMDGSYLRDARVIYEELLRRDRDDHMGARYEVIQIYHAESDYEALGRVLDALSAKVDMKTDALMTTAKNYDEKTRNRFVHLSRIVYFCTAGKTPNACDQEFNKPDW